MTVRLDIVQFSDYGSYDAQQLRWAEATRILWSPG